MMTQDAPVDPWFWSETQDRFWSHVHKSYHSDCWLWTGATRKGYGSFKNSRGQLSLPRKDLYAHRVAFFLTYKHWPTPIARHTCDTPLCCNPSHIIEGTHKQNTQDIYERGRGNHPGGCSSVRSKLTPAQVEAIRASYPERNQHVLAREYGISQSVVSQIVNGVTYK